LHKELQRAESTTARYVKPNGFIQYDGGTIKTMEELSNANNTQNGLESGSLLFMPFLAADVLDAQIIDQIDANTQHSFMIQKKTFPPGKYVFRIDQGSDAGSVLSTADGKNLDQFNVRDSIAATRPVKQQASSRERKNRQRPLFQSLGKTALWQTQCLDLCRNSGLATACPDLRERG
jgi:hypothetical protein